jgi:hypothetical protein
VLVPVLVRRMEKTITVRFHDISFHFILIFSGNFMVDLAFLFDFGILLPFSDFSGIRFAMSRYQTHETRMKRMALERHGAL